MAAGPDGAQDHDELTGDELTGDKLTGDKLTGDELTGDELTGESSPAGFSAHPIVLLPSTRIRKVS
jgi:hypothetical protein